MFDELPLKLIRTVTVNSLRLAWKYGLRMTIGLVGLTTIITFISMGLHGGFSFFIITIYGIVFGVILGVNLIFGIYIGIYAGLLTYIFQKNLPTSRKYRQIIMWGVFASCGLIPYVLFLRMESLNGLRETFALVLAAYGGWLAARLVDWIEEFGGMLPVEITQVRKKEATFVAVYRIKKLREKGLNRYQIDIDLLRSGFNPVELETAWNELTGPENKPRFNFEGWATVFLSAVSPVVIGAAFVGLVSLIIY